jgi:hypothetical protein
MPAKVAAKKSPFHSALVGGASFTVGTEATNVITVAVQLKNQSLRDLASRGHVDWYLSADANGDTVATAASGGVAAGTDGVVATTITGKAGFAISEADGDIDFAITDTGTPTMYLVLRLPDGSLAVSGVITFV